MSLGKKAFAAPARLWMNWPLWGGLLAALLLAKHVWVLFAPAEHAVPATTVVPQSAQTEQLFGVVSTADSSASLNGIRPIGIFASRKNGFAVMMTETGQIGVGLGGEVVPGVRLLETHADHVILERNGVQHRVDLGKAPAATDRVTQVQDTVQVRGFTVPPAMRGMTIPPAGGQLLDQLTPEQQKILQQQQQELIRGRH
ncbi:MAG: type II secretion system protein N [Sideroxyarcus sp.]